MTNDISPIPSSFPRPPHNFKTNAPLIAKEILGAQDKGPLKSDVSVSQVGMPKAIDHSDQIKKIAFLEEHGSVERLEAEVKELEIATGELDQEIEALRFLVSLDSEKVITDESYLLEMVEASFGPIEFVSERNKTVSEILEMAVKSELLPEDLKGLEIHQKATALTSLLTSTLDKLIKLSMLMHENNKLKLVEEELKTLEKELDAELNKNAPEQDKISEYQGKIAALNEEIADLSEEVKSRRSELLTDTALALPSVADSGYTVLRWLAHVKEISGVTFGLSAASSVADVITAGIAMRKASAEAALHQKEIQELKPPEVTLDPLKPETMQESARIIQGLINKRHAAREKRLELSEKPFFEWLGKLLRNRWGDISQIATQLKQKGIDLKDYPEKGIRTIEDFQQRLAIDPAFKQSLLERYVERKETLSTAAKDLLKSRILEKEKISGSFFNFKSTKSKVFFALTTIISVAAITIGALVLAGVSLPLLPVLLPTLATMALAVGVVAVSLCYLHSKKPNMFSETLKGLKIQKAFVNIPLMFHAWRLSANKAKMEQNSAALKFLSAKVETLDGLRKLCEETNEDHVPPPLLQLYHQLRDGAAAKYDLLKEFNEARNAERARYQQEKEALDAKVAHYEERYASFNKMMKGITDKLEEARKKDYELKTGFKMEDFEILAEALIDGEFWRDQEAARWIGRFTDSDFQNLEKMATPAPKTLERMNVGLSRKLKNIVLKSSEESLAWLKNQEIRASA